METLIGKRFRHLVASLILLTKRPTVFSSQQLLAQGEMQGLDLQAMIFHNYTVFLKMRENFKKLSQKRLY